MFLRFSKGAYCNTNKNQNRKVVFINNSAVMEYGNDIVGAAKLIEETDKCLSYVVVVAKNCELGSVAISRFIKDTIGKSNKFSDTPSTKRRKYYVNEYDVTKLPIEANLQFSKI